MIPPPQVADAESPGARLDCIMRIL